MACIMYMLRPTPTPPVSIYLALQHVDLPVLDLGVVSELCELVRG